MRILSFLPLSEKMCTYNFSSKTAVELQLWCNNCRGKREDMEVLENVGAYKLSFPILFVDDIRWEGTVNLIGLARKDRALERHRQSKNVTDFPFKK